MLVKEIKAIATKKGIKPGKLKKADLIRAIQEKEGNIPCFKSEQANNCEELGCLWRDDCIGKK